MRSCGADRLANNDVDLQCQAETQSKAGSFAGNRTAAADQDSVQWLYVFMRLRCTTAWAVSTGHIWQEASAAIANSTGGSEGCYLVAVMCSVLTFVHLCSVVAKLAGSYTLLLCCCVHASCQWFQRCLGLTPRWFHGAWVSHHAGFKVPGSNTMLVLSCLGLN